MPGTGDDDDDLLSRRSTLLRAGGLAAAALGAAGLPATAAAIRPRAALTCVLTPEMTEGPYYLPGERMRRSITEGQPGVPLSLRLTVLDASSCKPVAGATVDVWHASAAGTYSGEQDNGTLGRTFLRGIQRTDAEGLARFETVYPGWYHGRAVHIHVKVHGGGHVVHTGQLFFRDAFTDGIYREAPYRSRGAPDTRNAQDSIYADGGSRSLLRMRTTGRGTTGSIAMGIRRA